MGGKLLLTPTDLSNPNLRILDSATGNGYWLLELGKSLAPSATLMAQTSLRSISFHDLPQNVTLTTHPTFHV